MKWEVSFLGQAFEGAFKLGFLKDILNDYESFKEKQVFTKLKDELKEHEEGFAYLPTLFLLEENIPFEPIQNPPENLKSLGLKNAPQNYLLFLFLVGYYEGYFYQKSLGDVKLIKYHMGEESSQAGLYTNADLLFIANNTLYVVDFKLAGAISRLSKLFATTTEDNELPYSVYGLPVNLSLGELGFEKFVENILKVEKKLLALRYASGELKGFLQILSYAVDYLCEKPRENLKEVCLSLLYPLAEPFVARFYLEGKDLTSYREEIRDLYSKVKEKTWEYEKIDPSSKARISRLAKQTKEEIENLKKEIERREKKIIAIKPDSIHSARDDVRGRLKEFLKLNDPVKAICLFHSAGSGKTSQTRELIFNSEGNHIVFYFATRKVLVDREYKAVENKRSDVALVYEKKSYNKGKYVHAKGDIVEPVSGEAGIIQRTMEKIKRLTTENKRFIWAFATQQAVVVPQKNKISTLEKHITKNLSSRILRKYTFHFILDEFFGHQNGLFTIEEFFKVLRAIKDKGGRANLYLFDANGYTPILLKKLLVEYKKFEVIPNAVVLNNFKNRLTFEEDGIKVYSFAKHGYPSPEINLIRKFIFIEDEKKEEPVEKFADFIEETFKDKDKSTAFVFIQYKDHLSMLKEKLEKKGFNVLVATADSKKSQERINKGNEDIILATSAISRGIDLSRRHKPVNKIYTVIYHWGIEGNLVELIQSISRARGDEKTEREPKTLYLTYVIYPANEEVLDKIEEYLEEEKVDRELLEQLYKKHSIEQRLELDFVISNIITQFLKSSEGKVLVPIPTQYKTYYIPNSLSDIESVISFIEGIQKIENTLDELRELEELLISALSTSVVDLKLDSYDKYFHPYLLFMQQPLRFDFDNNKRLKLKNIIENLKDRIKEHNEDRVQELENLVENLLPNQQIRVPVLVPIYSIVLVRHFLKPGKKLEFKIRKNIGRGNADVLMGTIRPKTKCYCALNEHDSNEYACIALTEDYPYTEILSGRFAKFPVEFIKGLLEG
ncbi:MAG: C-terminal helicase domain-containing protein [Brevinematia bacterium]